MDKPTDLGSKKEIEMRTEIQKLYDQYRNTRVETENGGIFQICGYGRSFLIGREIRHEVFRGSWKIIERTDKIYGHAEGDSYVYIFMSELPDTIPIRLSIKNILKSWAQRTAQYLELIYSSIKTL